MDENVKMVENLCGHETELPMILLKERRENSKIEKADFEKADFNKLRILEDLISWKQTLKEESIF